MKMENYLKSRGWSDLMRPRAKNVQPLDNYRLLITFVNDEKKNI
jgi:hypothetical protein